MWWECSECGFSVERSRRPLKCRNCGTAGPVFTPVDEDDVQLPTIGNLRQAWFEFGFHRAHEDLEELAAAA